MALAIGFSLLLAYGLELLTSAVFKSISLKLLAFAPEVNALSNRRLISAHATIRRVALGFFSALKKRSELLCECFSFSFLLRFTHKGILPKALWTCKPLVLRSALITLIYLNTSWEETKMVYTIEYTNMTYKQANGFFIDGELGIEVDEGNSVVVTKVHFYPQDNPAERFEISLKSFDEQFGYLVRTGELAKNIEEMGNE